MSLIYHLTHVHLDFGSRSLLASECERVGIKKPLIVTDAGVRAAGGQMWKRAARADLGPVLLVAPQIAPTGCRLPRCTARGFSTNTKAGSAKARSGRLERASGASRSAGLVAARAARIVN